MAELGLYRPSTPALGLHKSRPTIMHMNRLLHIRCFSNQQNHDNINMKRSIKTKNSIQLLSFAVSGVTELLRLFSSFFNKPTNWASDNELERDEISVSSVDDVVAIIEYDYRNSYFVTGIFTSSIYAEDCVFEDPTIRFRGKELYGRNLKLLVPFFDSPSIELKRIDKNEASELSFVVTTWKLRTYLKLPWRPLINIDGSTVYELDDRFMITKHAESWSVTAMEAIGQIFRSSSRKNE